MKKLILMCIPFVLGIMIACNSGNKEDSLETTFIVQNSGLDDEDGDEWEAMDDSLKNGPFINRVRIWKNDAAGGVELYELKMNLYDDVIADGRGAYCYGILTLSVKSPDGTEPIEVARRIINKVYSIEENEAKILMDNGEERPISFEATITYNPKGHSYSLKMDADSFSMDDLIENTLNFD